MSTMNKTVGTIVLVVFAIIVLILLAYALYLYSLFSSLTASIGLNPYCVRELCTPDGQQIPAYQVSPSDDPTKSTYETLTYCLANAPPCELISAMNTCAGIVNPTNGNTEEFGQSAELTKTELEQILKFYDESYYPRCHYRYNGPTVTENPNAPSNSDVNSVNLVEGPNDDFLVALLACSGNKFDLKNNVNWQNLNRACGKVCQ